ncbi:hypothetical protein P8452_51752 [Trifolium repens]|nr:hypothetical protein P8452_51752 [Trifolium repens]
MYLISNEAFLEIRSLDISICTKLTNCVEIADYTPCKKNYDCPRNLCVPYIIPKCIVGVCVCIQPQP